MTNSHNFRTPGGALVHATHRGNHLHFTVQTATAKQELVFKSIHLEGESFVITSTNGSVIRANLDDGLIIQNMAGKLKKGVSAGWIIGGALAAGIVVIMAIGAAQPDSEPRQAYSTPAAEAVPSQPLPGIGDPISVKNAGIMVTNVLERESVGIHNQYLMENASEGGVLVVIEYKVKNYGNTPIKAYDVPELWLVDQNGTKYNKEAGKTIAYASEVNLDRKAWSDVNPDIVVNDAVVFEVSKTRFDRNTWYAITKDGQKISLALAQ